MVGFKCITNYSANKKTIMFVLYLIGCGSCAQIVLLTQDSSLDWDSGGSGKRTPGKGQLKMQFSEFCLRKNPNFFCFIGNRSCLFFGVGLAIPMDTIWNNSALTYSLTCPGAGLVLWWAETTGHLKQEVVLAACVQKGFGAVFILLCENSRFDVATLSLSTYIKLNGFCCKHWASSLKAIQFLNQFVVLLEGFVRKGIDRTG